MLCIYVRSADGTYKPHFFPSPVTPSMAEVREFYSYWRPEWGSNPFSNCQHFDPECN